MREYYNGDEIIELFDVFDEKPDWDHTRNEPLYVGIAKQLITEAEHGNNRRILAAILPSLFVRCRRMIAKTSWETQVHHEEMSAHMEELRPLLGGPTAAIEISVSDERPFTAKSEIRDLVATADGPLFLVDAYVGISTLDCLRDVSHPIRILTGQQKLSVEPGFESSIRDFRAEGRTIVVRRHPKLHDRYLIFNDRCWLIGSSIKDAGKKALNVIECLDSRQTIVSDAEKKWTEGIAYL